MMVVDRLPPLQKNVKWIFKSLSGRNLDYAGSVYKWQRTDTQFFTIPIHCIGVADADDSTTKEKFTMVYTSSTLSEDACGPCMGNGGFLEPIQSTSNQRS
jgi:hypothetical protein